MPPRSRGRSVVHHVVLACSCALACSSTDEPAGSSSSTGPDEPHATLLAQVAGSVCDDPKVVAVQITAVQVGCEHPPPSPCTLPADPPLLQGDMASCPITDPTVQLGLVVDRAAEYQVEVVADRSPEAATLECYAESMLQTSVRVTSVDLDVRASKSLVAIGQPCPDG
ncbi:MAG: hypothetical protein K1X88_25950 [Nannocystaceae bacterium]|nr:hypothetical protein [Nannocystaceae bacterium]